MALSDLIGTSVQGKTGSVDTSTFCGEGRYVGLYFSAHWCPPCRMFTPILSKFYETFTKKQGNEGKLEIVFISSDQDEAQFNSYYAEMPWLALPYAQRDMKKKLCEKFGVRGIPTFIILDSQSGAVVCAQARNALMNDEDGENFPWSK